MSKQKIVDIELTELVLDPEVYPRWEGHAGVDWQTVAKYTQAMRNGAKFPPIHVVRRRDGKYVLLDGAHRVDAAKGAKREGLPAIAEPGLFEDEAPRHWYLIAAQANAYAGRPYSTQDRAMIAYKLKQYGYDADTIASVVHYSRDELETIIALRVVKDSNTGKAVPLKAAVAGMSGTTRQQKAIEHQRPIANADVYRTLDEMLGLCRADVFEFSDPRVSDAFAEIVQYDARKRAPLKRRNRA